MSDMTGFIGGLAKGLDAYLGTQTKLAGELAVKKQEQDYGSQLKMKEQAAQQENEYQKQSKLQVDEMNRQQANKKFEQSLEGQVDEATANSIVKDSGDMVAAFKKMNGRNPTVSEAHQLFQSSPKAQGLHQTDPQDLYTMGQIMGMPEESLSYIKSLKGPIATGLAEKLLNVGEKGVNETALYKAFNESTAFDKDTSPQQKEASWTQFRASMLEPGKESITDEETLNKAVTGLDQVASAAMKNGKTMSQAMAVAAGVIKKYDKRTKAKLLTRAMMDMQKTQREAQQPQDPSAAQPGQ